MLERSDVATRLPVQDLKRARSFYAEKLGLEPIEERPGGLLYRCGRGFFARGVVFEEYDLPGLKTVNGIAQIAGNYPSKGRGEKGAWFKDSEGNLVGIGQPVP
jgi:catechol 2,3-dioxygenase-like lactoylglutathione lyase family enzyme